MKELTGTYNASQAVIYEILRRKDEIQRLWSQTKNANAKTISKTMYENINKAVYEWYESAQAENKPVTRLILQQKARQLSTSPAINDKSFKASNGWLESFIKRHGITFGKPNPNKKPNNKYFQRIKAPTNLPKETTAIASYKDVLHYLEKMKTFVVSRGHERLFVKLSECVSLVETELTDEEMVNHSQNLQRTGTFKIVKTISKSGSNVCAVPENWEVNNILLWPTHLDSVERNKLRADSESTPESNWTKMNCLIKLENVETFAEALQCEKQFDESKATTQMEDELRTIKFQNEFLTTKFQLFEKETQQRLIDVDDKLNKLTKGNRDEESADGMEQSMDDDSDEHPIKIECLLIESTGNDRLDNENGEAEIDENQLN